MKKWIVFILLLITTAGTFYPCCQADDCCADRVPSKTNDANHEEEGTCSPFYACATCPGSIELAKSIQLIHPVEEHQMHHERMKMYHLPTFLASYWQPPRSC
ncbi:MAG: hypothetical protein ABIQ56_06545 [Chitinophagaceae bacterium]